MEYEISSIKESGALEFGWVIKDKFGYGRLIRTYCGSKHNKRYDRTGLLSDK
jgi:hypothetical protein